jgi:DNA-binding NtrC family response regulator
VVLFVDDEEAVLRAIARVLAGGALEVLTTTHPSEALEWLREREIDVLVSDIDMPEMNGLELLRAARRERPDVLRMLLTGAATLERALHAINEGEVVRFFTKPFRAEAFRFAMDALAGRIASARSQQAESVRAARQRELHAWLDARFPGLLELTRTDDGEVVLDAGALDDAASVAGNTALLRCLAKEG